MLMVLMAIVELGRSRVHAATRWLWLLLSGGLAVGATSCATASGDDASGKADVVETVGPADDVPQVLYGPPPSDAIDVASDVPQLADCPMMTYYGPQPCDTDEECAAREGPGSTCDKDNWYDDGCGGKVQWPLCTPPAAIDAIEPDAAPDAAVTDCGPAGWYGPPPCTSDADCEDYGEDWYCDKTNQVDTPCGPTTYPMCVPGSVDTGPADVPATDCSPMVYYGPPPCSTDEDCKQYGPQWYCNHDTTLTDGCGNVIATALCDQKS